MFQKKSKQANEESKDTRKTSNGVVGGEATAGNINRNRSPSKMTKYVECWGADKPFANITESTLAKNIGLTVSIIKSIFIRLRILKAFPSPYCDNHRKH